MRRALRLTKRTRAELLRNANSRFRFRAGTFRNAIAVHQFLTAQFARKEMTMPTIENDSNPPRIQPFFSDRVLELADEVVTYMMNEIDDGWIRPAIREFTAAERAAFFASLADAFSDTTEN
jgi:hypothetical protein